MYLSTSHNRKSNFPTRLEDNVRDKSPTLSQKPCLTVVYVL